MRWLLSWVVIITACGESDPPLAAETQVPTEAQTPPATEETAETPEQTVAVQPEPEVRAALRTDVGWAEVPALPSAEAREANARGLRQHRRQNYEESLASFRAALALSDSYVAAQFNVACALAKLDRMEEAAVELESLLPKDLPTFGPRYASEDDFVAFRETPQAARIDTILTQLARSYTALMNAGPAVILKLHEAFEEDLDADDPILYRRWRQAGVWVRETRRFVPMGPMVSLAARAGTTAIVQTRFYPRRRRATTFTALDYQSDMGSLGVIHVRVFSAPDGRELGSARPRFDVDDSPSWFGVRAVDDGFKWSTGNVEGYVLRETVEVLEPPARVALGATYDDARARLTIGNGEGARIVPMRRHRGPEDMSTDTELLPHGEDAILVLTTNEIGTLDGTMYGDWILSRVKRSTGEVERLRHGEQDRPRMSLASDGTVYFSTDGGTESLPTPGGGEPDVLPSALVL